MRRLRRRLHDSKSVQQVPDGLLFGTMPEGPLGERYDKLCKMIKKKGGAEQLYADKQYKASIKLAVEKCAKDARSQAAAAAKQLGDLSFCDMEERKRFLELSAEDAEIEEDEVTCFICLDSIHSETEGRSSQGLRLQGITRPCPCHVLSQTSAIISRGGRNDECRRHVCEVEQVDAVWDMQAELP